MTKLLALLITGLLGSCLVAAQSLPPGLRLWLRADTLTTVSNGVVQKWGSIVGGHTATAQPGAGLTLGKINNRPAIEFANSAYYSAPSVFPVRRDYTMYLVFHWNGVHAANNMVSGQNRAFFTNAPGVPTVLHNGDFGRLGVSSQTLSGPTVIRVVHTDSSGRTRIALNNEHVSDDLLPRNVDSTIFLGAYQGGYGLNGSIAEVLIFDRNMSPAEQITVEKYLHDRYAIKRAAEPPQPVVRFLTIPRSLEVADASAGLTVRGVIISDSLEEIKIDILREGESIASRTYPKPNMGDTVACQAKIRQELASFSTVVTARRLGGTVSDTMVKSTDIVPGIVFAVNGQSNSIFGDASLPISIWARTFGGNFSQAASDTNYMRSTATGNGGGNNVGAWALSIQNAMADQLKTASLCISGGVGGTRIEQHLPDESNRLNLSTIYGSWLYRVIKSGSRERISWMFWYQGESNHDDDNYTVHFEKLRAAWKQDLPNLRYIVVVQIRPGCAGPSHAKLREDQARLQDTYPDVIVHAAAGLPGHDGCHYSGIGYSTLAEQLFDVYQRNSDFDRKETYRSSPRPTKFTLENNPQKKSQTVAISFDGDADLIMTSDALIGGNIRRAADAFFANGQGAFHPTSVSVGPKNQLNLVFSDAITVRSVSYVPDYTYDDGTVFQGPWLMTRAGVGALSFHARQFDVTSAGDDPESPTDTDSLQEIVDLTGRVVGTSAEELQLLPTGAYLIRYARSAGKIYMVR